MKPTTRTARNGLRPIVVLVSKATVSRARFGIDVDGVMYHFQKTALYMLNTMKGYNLKLEDWRYWNQPKDAVKNNDWQWLWTGGVKDGLFRYGHLYKGTIEAMRALAV